MMMPDAYDSETERAAKRAEKRKANGHATGDWRDELAMSSQGRPLATLGNVMIALRRAPEWAMAFGWNDFSARPEAIRQLPGVRVQAVPRALADVDISACTIWMNQLAEIPVQSRITAEAVRTVADEHHFHPIRDYLAGLVWDGVPRLDMWLADHLGAEDTELNRAFASRWMIGMVARVMVPGCQMDAALIFESRQGLGKSSTLRALGGEWFTDHLPDLTSKDAMQQLQGVWIVEIAELDSLRRAETHRIKSFITARVDRFRPPYGNLPMDFPRQCGFAGTVNPGSNGYLRDETGARRFWTVACGVAWDDDQKADVGALAGARDQLWAEAMVRYQAGERWYLDTAELEAGQAEVAGDRREDDPREDIVAEFVANKSSVHMSEILQDCLHVPREHWNRALRTELGYVMSALGWERKKVRAEGNRLVWRYSPK